MIATSQGGYWLLANGKQSVLKTSGAGCQYACKCCGNDEIEQWLIDKLHILYGQVGGFNVNCCTRCAADNKAAGGAPSSLHLPITRAADIQEVNTPAALLWNASVALFKGVGLYMGAAGAYLHVDIRDKRLYWYRRAKGGYAYFTNAAACWHAFNANMGHPNA